MTDGGLWTVLNTLAGVVGALAAVIAVVQNRRQRPQAIPAVGTSDKPTAAPLRVPSPPSVDYAHWGWRVLSAIIDVAATYVAAFVFAGVAAAIDAPLGLTEEAGSPGGTASFWQYVGLVWILGGTLAAAIWNWIVLDGRTGRSLGRRLTRTQLVSERTGWPIGMLRATVRLLLLLVEVMLFVLLLLWYKWQQMAEGQLGGLKRQTITDKIVGSVVVRVWGDPTVAVPQG